MTTLLLAAVGCASCTVTIKGLTLRSHGVFLRRTVKVNTLPSTECFSSGPLPLASGLPTPCERSVSLGLCGSQAEEGEAGAAHAGGRTPAAPGGRGERV